MVRRFHFIVKRFHFCVYAGECLLKNEEQNFEKKLVITLFFKLKALVIGNKPDEAFKIKFNVVYTIRISLYIRKCTPTSTPIVIFHNNLSVGADCKFIQTGRASDHSVGVYTQA